MAKLNDLTNKTFGSWKVLYRNGSTPNKASVWRCKCLLCGSERDVVGASLTSGSSTKCRACVPRTTLKKPHRNERVYNIYKGMKQRCHNPNSPSYSRYGAKGIAVCQEWLNNPDAFIEWALKSGYTDALTLDRIDTTRGYSPDNCRWASYSVQANNRSCNVNIVYNGSTHTLANACRLANVSYNSVKTRCKRFGETPQEAFDHFIRH